MMHSISSGSSFQKLPAHRENFRRIETDQTQIPQQLRVFPRRVLVLLRCFDKRLDTLRTLWQTPTNGGILGSFVNWPGKQTTEFLWASSVVVLFGDARLSFGWPSPFWRHGREECQGDGQEVLA